MAQGSGFYHGEKKKKKKGGARIVSVAPVFVPPQVASKGKNRY